MKADLTPLTASDIAHYRATYSGDEPVIVGPVLIRRLCDAVGEGDAEIAELRKQVMSVAEHRDDLFAELRLRINELRELSAAKNAEITRLTAERDRATDLMLTMAGELADMRQRAEKAEADARRYQWAKPILSGDDEDEADERTFVIARGLVIGRSVDETIDAALAASQPSTDAGQAGETR